MQITSIALGGLNAAETQFNAAASQIAAGSSSAAADTVDLSSSAVALLNAKDSYAANLATIKVGDEMTKQALDLIG